MDNLKEIYTNGSDDEETDQTSNPRSTGEDTSVATFQIPYIRNIQNFLIVWLDNIFDEINSVDIVSELREIVNTVRLFTDVNDCIDFITETEDARIFMITSGVFGQTVVPVVHKMPQLYSAYIFSGHKTQHELWENEWPKVKGTFTSITTICEALKQATEICDQNSVSISFIKKTDELANRNLNELDQSFMYTQILKEIFLDIDYYEEHIDDFLTYCREELFVGNDAQLENVDKIEQEYRRHQPIWWYTYNCFLYSMFNRAIRTMEMDLIMKMSFFIRDLHDHIAKLHSKQYDGQTQSNSFTVYRGQGLLQADFDELRETQGGLMLFNNFIFASFDRAASLALSESNQSNPDLVGVLFEITIDPSISSTSFANIHKVSAHPSDEKILFAMQPVFRIGEIKQIEGLKNRLWQIDLTLTNDNDPQMRSVTEYIRKETFSGDKGWYRLGNLLIKLDQLSKAQQVFDIMLEQTIDQGEKAKLYHALGLINHTQGNNQEAIEYYEKSIEINEKILPPTHLSLANSYSDIGEVYNNMSKHSQALSYHEKALDIREKSLPANHPDLATSYSNIGEVYNNMTKYSEALSYHEKALDIRQKASSVNQSDLACSHNNIGLVYNNMGEHSKALSSHKQALEIRRETLPSNHPDLVTSYKNIGNVYDNMGHYSEALLYYEQALEIEQRILPPNHPSLAISYNSIGGVYDEMDEHLKALSNYEKALEIFQEILPPDHPSFAISYNNIAGVYDEMKEYLEALVYYKKALELSLKTLPANHPYFAPLYGHIGMVYVHVDDHATARVYYERAIELSEHSLPSNHPHLKLYKDSLEFIKRNL